MAHVQIQVPGADAAAVTHAIAAEGLLHLVDIAHGRVPAPAGDDPGAQLASCRELAGRVRRTIERLDLSWPELAGGIDVRSPADLAAEHAALATAFEPIETEVRDAWDAGVRARDERDAAARACADAARLRQAGVPLARLRSLRFVTIRLARGTADALADLSAMLAPAPFAVVPLEQTQDTVVAAVTVPTAGTEALERGLGLAGLETLQLPPSCADADDNVLASDLARAQAAVEQADVARRTIAERHAATLTELATRVELAVVLLQARTHFAVAGRFVVIAGWVPADQSRALAARVTAVSGGRAVVTVERPDDMPEAMAGALRVPILMRNPILLRPFEGLVALYGTPSYREVQPTAFFAVSFLLMFGLMFGDIGHGATLFAAGYCLYRWVPRFLDYGILLMEVGVASAVFGALYGSFFGIEGLLPVLWMEPIRDLPRFMTIAVGLGAFLLSAGFVLNVVNSWRAGEKRAALFGLHGLFGAFLYWTTLVLGIRAVMPASTQVPVWLLWALVGGAAGLLVLRRPLLAWLERGQPPRRPGASGPWWLGALEGSVELADALVMFFANTVSFVRVAAFAAVHAGVFVAMFALADTIRDVRFGDVLSVAVLVAGNVAIILLEGLTVAVQVLRLEYYEFFGRFFRGGGEAYRPLMLRSRRES